MYTDSKHEIGNDLIDFGKKTWENHQENQQVENQVENHLEKHQANEKSMTPYKTDPNYARFSRRKRLFVASLLKQKKVVKTE